MKAALVLLLIVSGSVLGPANQQMAAADPSIEVFWEKFRGAVIKADKAAVAQLSQFPISTPYGVPKVRSKAQLIKRYLSIFYLEHDAPECFAQARPELNPENPKEFTVACKNAAGHEVIIYSFTRGRDGWKFTGLDNINE